MSESNINLSTALDSLDAHIATSDQQTLFEDALSRGYNPWDDPDSPEMKAFVFAQHALDIHRRRVEEEARLRSFPWWPFTGIVNCTNDGTLIELSSVGTTVRWIDSERTELRIDHCMCPSFWLEVRFSYSAGYLNGVDAIGRLSHVGGNPLEAYTNDDATCCFVRVYEPELCDSMLCCCFDVPSRSTQ